MDHSFILKSTGVLLFLQSGDLYSKAGSNHLQVSYGCEVGSFVVTVGGLVCCFERSCFLQLSVCTIDVGDDSRKMILSISASVAW